MLLSGMLAAREDRAASFQASGGKIPKSVGQSPGDSKRLGSKRLGTVRPGFFIMRLEAVSKMPPASSKQGNGFEVSKCCELRG